MELEQDENGDWELELTEPQTEFLLSENKYTLFVAGFGAGKSTIMTAAILNDLNYPVYGLKVGAYAPTYDLLKLITIPYLEEMLQYAGYRAGNPKNSTKTKKFYNLNKSDYIFYLPDGKQIICRSMDNPARIVGYQTFRAHVDELDVMQHQKAEQAWNKIIARNRQQVPVVDEDGEQVYIPVEEMPEEEQEFGRNDYVINDKGQIERTLQRKTGTHVKKVEKNKVSAYSTPEGFVFCYNRWDKKKAAGYGKIKAPSYSNPHLPPDYIPNLRASYPPEIAQAYIEGNFVNLTSGAVYGNFDRVKNHTNETIKKHEALHVGMDFNVHKMAASIFVIRDDRPMLLDEIFGSEDTPSLCKAIESRYPNHNVCVYPDCSGKSTSSKSASESDFTIIRSHNFTINAFNKHQPVKDRVMSVNAMILNGEGQRRLLVNTNNCPESTDCLEQQIYGPDGTPDKTANKDHLPDSIGYFIGYKYPIVSNKVESKIVRLF